MRRQRSHTKPKRLDSLERLSIEKLRRLRDLTAHKIAHLEPETSRFRTVASEQEKRERQSQAQQRLINDQISQIQNDPQSRRSGLSRILKGQYTDSAMAAIAKLEQQRWKLQSTPLPQYHTVEEYGLYGTATDIAAYLEKELNILRSELGKIDRIIERKVSKERRNSERRTQVAAALGKTRKHGAVVRRRLLTNHSCPYCGGPLGKDYHTDHIYPVSKGGHSSVRNMVNVCRTCNSRKGIMTLAAFISRYSLNRREIEERLLALDKDF